MKKRNCCEKQINHLLEQQFLFLFKYRKTDSEEPEIHDIINYVSFRRSCGWISDLATYKSSFSKIYLWAFYRTNSILFWFDQILEIKQLLSQHK